MAKISVGQPMDLILASQLEAKIGDYKWSHLETVDFNEEHLGDWMPCDGRSSVGTDFAAKTGEQTVPNALLEGTFIRQAKAGRAKGTYEGDAIRNITGRFWSAYQAMNSAGGDGVLYPSKVGGTTAEAGNSSEGEPYNGWSIDASRQVPTADENRSKNIALNLYVKVNY